MRKKCKDCKKDTTKVEFPFESSRCFECRELWYISRRPRINGKTIYDLRKELQLYQRHISNIIGMDRRKYVNIELDYKYNAENDPNRFYYRSDHYSFAKNNIPVIFYFNGTHADYHKISDTPDKINYDLLEIRSRLIFHTAWEVANREERLVVDKIKDKVKP